MFSVARKAALSLAVAAMVFRALLPLGWMPNPEGFGNTALIPCDGVMSDADMAMMMPGMDMSSMHHGTDADGKAPASGHTNQECPYAAAAHGGTPAVESTPVTPSLTVQLIQPPSGEQAVLVVARYQPQSPRAPPHSVI
ncbi:MAG TPA: hypothetical protein VGM68_06655 [Rhizomicrobium sp.]